MIMNYSSLGDAGRIFLLKIVLLIAGIVMGFFILRIFIFPFSINDDAMHPNFNKGKKIFLLRFFSPKIGDVVLIESPHGNGELYLRRIAAREGDTVEIQKGEIQVNSAPVQFTWKVLRKDDRLFPMDFSMRDYYPVVKLKRNEYFVLCDNLDRGMDSRFFGPVQKKHIKGRYVYTFPFMK